MEKRKARSGYKLVKTHYRKEKEIPSDWEYGELNSRIEILSGFAFKSNFFNNEKGTPLIRIRDLSNNFTETFYTGDYDNEYIVKRDDLLVGMDGEFKPYLWKGNDSLLNQRVCKLTTNNKTLDQKFIYYIIGKELVHYELINLGTTVIHISKSDIEKISIPYPLINEQQKIALILSNIDSLISLYNEIIQKTIIHKKGLIQKLLTKGIGHTKFKKINLKQKFLEFSIPEEWDVKSLQKVSRIIDTPHYTSPLFDDGQIPVITTSDCDPNGIIDYSNVNYTSKEEYLKRSKVINPKKGDILFTREAPLGIAEIVDREEIVVGQRIILLKFDKNKVNAEFLVSFLNSHIGKLQSNSLAIKTTVERVNISDVKKFMIPIPPIEEQKEVVSILSKMDSKINYLDKEKSHLESLKKGLMQKLLTGQIRVKA